MSIRASVEDMRQEAVNLTSLGTQVSIVWEQVGDVIVEVFADAASVEYIAKVEDEIFYTTNINIFAFTLEYALQ